MGRLQDDIREALKILEHPHNRQDFAKGVGLLINVSHRAWGNNQHIIFREVNKYFNEVQR